MKKCDAIKHFGSSTELANKLNITKQSVSQWDEDIPPLRAFEIERLTNGSLKVDSSPIDDVGSQSNKLINVVGGLV